MIWRERLRQEVLKVLEEHDVFSTKDAVARDIAEAIPSPDERNGFVIVPKLATDKMICAALDDYDKKPGQSYRDVWNAMVKAAALITRSSE